MRNGQPAGKGQQYITVQPCLQAILTWSRHLRRRVKVTQRSEATALTKCEAVAHQEKDASLWCYNPVRLLQTAGTVLAQC